MLQVPETTGLTFEQIALLFNERVAHVSLTNHAV